jgi:IS1 family transposase
MGKKANRQWLWIVLEAKSRQELAFHVMDRSRKSAEQLAALSRCSPGPAAAHAA